MALLYFDSFDHYLVASSAGKLADYGVNATISAGNGRNSTSSLRVTNIGATGRVDINTPNASGAQARVGFAFRMSTDLPGSQATIASLYLGSTQQFNISVNSTGTITARYSGNPIATSVSSLSVDTWYFIEFSVTLVSATPTGVFDVLVDGVSVLSSAGDYTAQTGASWDAFVFYGGASQAHTYDIDDLYVCDGSGSTFNALLGDRRVAMTLPDGVGNDDDWAPTSGDNYTNVDDATPDSGSTEVVSDTVGHTDLHTHAAVGVAGTVEAVQYVTWAKADQAGVRDIVAVCRIGGTTYEHPTPHTLGGDWQHYRWIWEESPATASPWTVAEIDGAEFGYRIAA